MQIDPKKVATKLTANWKSTAMGLAIAAIAVLRSVQFDVAGHLAMTAKDWAGVMVGALGMVIGMIQKDAGTEQAQLPSGEIANVDSHEDPDDPANKVVK